MGVGGWVRGCEGEMVSGLGEKALGISGFNISQLNMA